MTDRTAQADAGRRYRLYPTPEQAETLIGWEHTCRAVWNVALEQRQFAWSQRRHILRAMEQCRHLTQARAELPWMADLPAQAAQQVLRHLDAAYDNWWNPDHPAGAPLNDLELAPLRWAGVRPVDRSTWFLRAGGDTK